jgi:AraC-like DNA-binding protein
MTHSTLWKIIKPSDDTITDPICKLILDTWYNTPYLGFIGFIRRETGASRQTVRRRFKRLVKMGYAEQYYPK